MAIHFFAPSFALGKLTGSEVLLPPSILPCSTLHIPTSAQGWLSPCPEGMPEDEFSGTTFGLPFCRKQDPCCPLGQLVEASGTTAIQSAKQFPLAV